MSIDRWNFTDCKYAFLNAKNCMSAAERQESTREFCMALWYHECPERADNDMIINVVLYLTNCAKVCNNEHDFELIANAIRNAYYDGKNKGYRDGYLVGFNVAEDEERG